MLLSHTSIIFSASFALYIKKKTGLKEKKKKYRISTIELN